jgi:hypothetical protein
VLRSDSRLCENYIQTGVGDPIEIANTMAEMKFLFAHTHYKHILENLKERASDELDDAVNEWRHNGRGKIYRPEFYEHWNHQDASVEAKGIALERWATTEWRKGRDPKTSPLLPPSLLLKLK